MSRRDVLRYGAAAAVSATTVAVATQTVTAARSDAAPQRAAADPRDFDEVYKGKKIKGKHHSNGKHELHINNKKLALTPIDTLFVPEDGSAPHVGVGYISALNHYDPVEIDESQHKDGLKKLAKKAVDTLGEFELGDEAGLAHHH
ncbi:tyrosinase family oxidase copper chaperone [Couchioplanes azureus]|uniref:tyrosinase family oxidase copper chaperone n=1 Tax=Couchioplanes caeruleus TaxID=56438 RepID=UPI00166FF493|nr:tyrosinase family oxidase copper chaperone [Couchioplanes caeruleus]